MLGAAPTPWLRTQMGFPTSPWGLLSPFLTLHLLRLGSAEFRVTGPGQPLLAIVGQDVVLPCHLSPGVDTWSLEIRWIRYLVSETVHLYRNGEDQYGEQMEEYDGRTELARDGLSRGILDLRISGLRPSDNGQYVCTVQDGASYGEAVVELKVAAMGSVPLLSLEAYEDGGIRVVCRSAGWYPSPEVLWRDGEGQHLPSVSLRHSPDERGLFEIQDVIVVSGKGDGNVSCVVRNSRLEQEEASSLHISAPFFHNARPWMAALGVFLLLSVVSAALSAYLFRRKVVLSRALGKRGAALGEQADLLRNREAELDQRDAALRDREGKLEERDAALKERDAALGNREAELVKRQRKKLKHRRKKLKHRSKKLQHRRKKLQHRLSSPNCRSLLREEQLTTWTHSYGSFCANRRSDFTKN
ncbi:PREDICTED: LOW QUALITY PROTEIN: butyrophilin subfamily 3 member A2-like [Calidris pugnax]|uniref:LOW QUALITY PROTEIN: butyrophilin subfamily 3 member A2-like n=1 Tax=Calidris pugnax TaxID=198806 RepID=UPI00071E4DF7|nr:PREDICTED: LOW QUALITY PROTEIN: butyrophilin subfamily 3 member A2-like [Calidris pugnax]